MDLTKIGPCFLIHFISFLVIAPCLKMWCLLEIWHHNPNVIKLKCIWNKYITYGKLKIISTSEIYKAIYHDGSCALLFEKRNLKVLKLHVNNYSGRYHIDNILLRKSMDWFLYDNGLRLERVKCMLQILRWFWCKPSICRILTRKRILQNAEGSLKFEELKMFLMISRFGRK